MPRYVEGSGAGVGVHRVGTPFRAEGHDMPRFYFDLSTSEHFERDAVGAMFATLEAAYLDACRAVIDISFELLRERKDPSRYQFEIRDAGGQVVWELPFAEVLQPGRTARPRQIQAHDLLRQSLDRNRKLKSELVDILVQTRESAMRGVELSKVRWAVAGTVDSSASQD